MINVMLESIKSAKDRAEHLIQIMNSIRINVNTT